ncbi:L-threonylcarbamoyladenylate synthase [Candidatus Hydrogenosomobacter endosymbioticus]|uniref:L-threonylcarbamoyladenylate synthase n=1 Tax=Candidatus Hydrogenosomobacter endosymbioticus TaxID=2558174 RepID=A0ABM7V9Y1_9PROT|nr:L-threonylcarbamoyladenylate synthase [Candidatus Hydrogenosomobacter endosymbioticus]BDB96326.1 hypothetical protein HYD_4590 [Candidatus Hydrogenosomobacter endosymbioticus]
MSSFLTGNCDPILGAAAESIKNSGVVVVPTETVYGLACNALDVCAIKKLFVIKKRDISKQIPVICQSQASAEKYVEFPACADLLAKKFWPGPLTLVLKKLNYCKIPGASDFYQKRASSFSTDGTLAVRVSSHKTLQLLLSVCNVPLAVTSANISGEKSPVRAEEVKGKFSDDIIIIDGGKCEYSVESTIVDATENNSLKILRHGAINEEQIFRAAFL